MELKFEVVLSSSIKRKKPWPRFCWLGQEKESVFLLDDKRISEINMVSGRTKKRTPKLHPLLSSVVKMASSHNGMWLCGLLASGELFLWNRDKDLLKIAAAEPEVVQMINSAQGNCLKLCLQVSCNGTRVLLAAVTGQVFLWESTEGRDFPGLRDGPVKGQWAHLLPLEETLLPSSKDKEASQHTIFVKTEVLADICLSAFVFTSGKQLVVTILKIQWSRGSARMGSVGYNIEWATKTYPMSHLCPPCQPVKSRGALVPAFSPDGRLLAIALNQRKPKDTQVLFVSTHNFVSISSHLGGCGSKKMDIPSKYVRSYWVSSVSWSAEGLFFACVLKRGSLLMLARLGGLLTLTSSGCNVDFGPAHFLPLHPLVTYRPPLSAGNGEASLSSSSLSVRDLLRQRFSVTWHPRLLYLIVSDGYMATVMKVRDRHSLALFLEALLKETGRDLEKASVKLEKSQVHLKAWLDSMSWFNSAGSLEELGAAVTRRPKASDPAQMPLFLQNQQTLGGTRELLESMQAAFEEESDLEGLPAGPHVQEGGRLEFASMFDTLHAADTYGESAVDAHRKRRQTEKKNPLSPELGKIQRKLLAAWALAMSVGDAAEHRVRLLRHALRCVVWFAALLRSAPRREKDAPVGARLLRLIKALLSFLSWDSASSAGRRCLGPMVEFSEWMARLLLTPPPDAHLTGRCPVSSQSLSDVTRILHLVSASLDRTYCLEQKSCWSNEEEFSSSRPHLWPSDVCHVPLLQDVSKVRCGSDHRASPFPGRPSGRLLGVWQLVYDVAQRYAEELRRFRSCDGSDEEEQKLSVVTSRIQTALQATGGNLEEGRPLLSYQGEHLFLCGLYSLSTQTLRLQICQEASKGGDRSVFQQTRLCLALLYSLLSRYRLREAQEFGDGVAQLILLRAGSRTDSLTGASDPLPCPWLPVDLPADVARAVVQALGRFMASYFTNQPLFIPPAHNVAVLPPLHLPHASGIGRLVPLCQEEVAKAVRQQHLSEVWTVDYAQDLLLVGGVLPEAVWLASHLGDWKTAVTLSLAYTTYCAKHFDFTQLRRRDFLLPTEFQPESIFQAELRGLLGSKTDSRQWSDKDGADCFTDPLEGEDWELLRASVHDILKASAMAGVDVMSFPLSALLEKAKDACSLLPTLVPAEVYLPSPPLYCPQPSPNTQDPMGETEQFAEVICRHKVSGVLQRLLLLLRSAHCCRPAAQWYVGRLRRARHILHKIKKKYSYPSAAEEEETFPEGLMKLISRSGYFRRDSNKEQDPDTIQTIICFRELCALCWMLHVRDQLSLHCRKYQAGRQRYTEEAIPDDSHVNSTNADALRWACRLLPFAHFLGGEEVLQDLILSLLPELPPVSLAADTLVRAFPQEEESVRVSLREKYNLLLQRLGQCCLLGEGGEDGNEPMTTFIQDRKRHRRKHLARLRRHLAPPELHLWQKADEDEGGGGANDTLSLGTTVSSGTLTDGAFQPVRSDADTPEAVSPKQARAAMSRSKKARKGDKKAASGMENARTSGEREKERRSLPAVGSWEFELEDEEYLSFLELFLSYVLEKDAVDSMDCGEELPLLKGFCSQLREKELHSLTFDVVSTIHRRQRGGLPLERKQSAKPRSAFRAGCSYRAVASSLWSEDPVVGPDTSSHPGRGAETQKGLLGRRRPSDVSSAGGKEADVGSESSFFQNAFTARRPSESPLPGFSSSVEAPTDLQEGLDPELEARFPELGRLLEWMVRWADRRMLLGHRGKKREDVAGQPDEGVVIRVKATAPAILTSLGMLENRYAAQPQADRSTSFKRIPERQWTVAPALPSDAERRTERESSVDTGYPASVNTPIAGLEHDAPQGETSPGSITEEREELTFPPPASPVQLRVDSQQRRPASPQQTFNDLDVTPEKEDRSRDCEGVDVFPSESSAGTSRDVCTPETSLKLEDLEYSEKDCVSSASSHYPVNPAPPTIQPKPPPHAESSDSRSVPLPDPAADRPRLQPPISSSGAAPADSTAATLPLLTSPTRQRLGDDLFRLVQHINYMSLSEVLGARFSSLQLAQQSSSFAAPTTNSSQPNMHLPSAPGIIPEPNAFPVQTTATAVPQTQARVPKSESGDPEVSRIESRHVAAQPVTQGAGVSLHHCSQSQLASAGSETKPLSVQTESPDVHQRQKRSLIPSSHGLLAATDDGRAVQRPPSDGGAQTGSAAQMLDVKLLKLHLPCAESQHAAAPRYAAQRARTLHTANFEPPESSQPEVPHHDRATWRKKDERQRNGFPVQIRNLLYNPAYDPLAVAQAVPLLPPVHGLRLLRLQDDARSTVTFPKLTTASTPRPAAISEAPIIRLLRIESGPKMVVHQEIRSSSVSRLTEDSMSADASRQDADVAQLQLNRGDQSAKSIIKPTSSSSSKRQKRREEKAQGRKTQVSFRPNESIIPTKEAAHVPESEEATVAEEIKPAQDITGTSEHLLSGERLLDKVFSTSAELHAFASTSKRPPERHDAFTNTEPAHTATLENTSVSVQASVMTSSPTVQPSASQENFPEDPVRGAVENQQEPQTFLDPAGRQFLSVLDLEDVRQDEGLEPRRSSEPRDVPSSVTSAQLHVLATSVICSAAAAESQSSVPGPQDLLKPRAAADFPEAHPSFSHSEPSSVAERIGLQEDASVDSSGSEVCRAIKAQARAPSRAPASPSAGWFSSRLSELDSQLAALQSIADHLETDFSNSRMLVNTIEKLSSDGESDAKAATGVKLNVRRSAPLKAWTSRPDPDLLPALKECDENKEEQEERHVLHDDSGIPATRRRSASSVGRTGGPSHLHIGPGIKEHFTETYDISHEWADTSLGQAELFDTMEILDDLVKEGYLSPSDWDLDSSQTARQSRRQDQQQRGWTLQKGTLPEAERKDVRIWMRRKQRERLAAYQKHRQGLREREHKPFSASSTGRSPNRRQASSGRNREEKEKFLLLKQYYQRTEEAFSLASDALASPGTAPSSSQPCGPPGLPGTWSTSDPAAPPGIPRRAVNVSANDKKSLRSQSGSSPPRLRYSVEGRPSEDLRRRLGLHRPVTFLPGDRLSQVTRRGMLSNTKCQPKLHAANQSRAQHVGFQTKTGFNSSFSSGAALQRGNLREQRQVKQPEAVKLLDSTRLEDEEDFPLVLARTLDGQDGAVTGGASEMDWLDRLSDSPGSSLSRIDWAAIERLVAAEED
ncbi:LOW QUALITY PROTEIN: ciliogenesis and planar polarity effector 1 [Fundulus heteroclitus]|uniref:LOW QUALITY PROTEIN: ciliogenesis and planar polarity effector 1 n=1 Tax=Fundulus heteroclitus TaxID=8078 RepID=UPI00165B2709|nr:LOW QUALITY PROTEIN: ciliogenesis and planar polarity effector 1 [Fundulus heteroclitus]